MTSAFKYRDLGRKKYRITEEGRRYPHKHFLYLDFPEEYKKYKYFKNKKEALAFLKEARHREKWNKSVTFKDILKASIGIQKKKM